MAIKITEECINCGACEPECPNNAIYEGGVEWAISDGTTVKGTYTLMDGTTMDADQKNAPVATDIYYIVLINVPNARVFMKNPSVHLFALLIAACRMKCIKKQLMSYWPKKKSCIFKKVLMMWKRFQHNSVYAF